MHLWLQRIGGDISSPSDVSQGILQGAEGPSVLQASRTASTHRAACWRVLALSLVLPVTTARSEDWPTVLHDNQRTGVSGQTLRPPLHLLWTYASPGPPAPGWSQPVNGYGARKHRPDVAYDDAFRVIAVGDACYFCSSAENRIYALDAATGRIRWTRFTDAAPRLAPAYWQGRLYVGADDGIFRCLDAASGAVCWQIKAAPRPDLMLGYGRFSSLWPIRAAGIADDGVAYFTAGLFPANHLYFYAVRADDGRVLWQNQLDRGGRECCVPQGYILSTADSLFLTSRVAPTRWSKQDGRPIDFQTPFPDVRNAHEYRFHNGGSEAQIWQGRYPVYGQACLLAYDPDRARTDRYGRPVQGELLFNWFNARQALFRGEVAYLATDDLVLAVPQRLLPELAQNECREFEEAYKSLRIADYQDRLDEYRRLVHEHGAEHPLARRLETGPLKWGRENWERWPAVSQAIYDRLRQRCLWTTRLRATEAFILAGDVIYAGSDDHVYALEASSGELLWRYPTASRVRGLAAAHGRLFVSTIDGQVCCLGREAPAAGPVHVASPVPGSLVADGPGDQAAGWAPQILRIAEVRRGYCLILGGEGGWLAAELARRTELQIEVLESEPEQVAPARERLAAAGLYASRVGVRPSSSDSLPYAPYLFNLVIDQGAIRTGRPSAPLAEILRVTRPCGGVAILGRAEGDPDRALCETSVGTRSGGRPDTVSEAGAELRREGDYWLLRRGPLPKASDWTHNYANAANTSCSGDPLVQGPFGVLWYGEPGPARRIDRHATPPMPLVVNGILFTLGYDRVMAYDAYNGLQHWERDLPGATRTHLPINTSNLVADAHSLFVVVDGRECLRLAAGTGQTLQRYVPPAGEDPPAVWAWMARDGDWLYGSLAEWDADRRRPQEQTSRTVFALDAQRGQPVWEYHGRGIDHDGIAIRGGTLFLLDRQLDDAERQAASVFPPPDSSVPDRATVDRRGQPPEPDLRKLVALDAATGRLLWQRPLNVTDVTRDDTAVLGKSGAAGMVQDGVVIVHGVGSLGHPHAEFLRGEFARRALYAFDAASGRYLWGGRKGYRKRPLIAGDRVYAEPFAWDLKTGRDIEIANPLSGLPQRLDFHRGYIGCGHLMASGRALFGARGGIACWNLDDPGGFQPFAGLALACGFCAAPANGVFVVPEGRSGCTCDTPIHASLALYPSPPSEAWSNGFTGGRADAVSLPVRHVCVNLGAPAYRRDAQGQLWIPYPARIDAGLLGDWLPTYQHDAAMCYQLPELHTAIAGTESPWLYTSGYAAVKPLRFRLLQDGDPPGDYTLTLHFAEPEAIQPGQRRFHVYVQGEQRLTDFDVVQAAGAPRRAVVRRLDGVRVTRDLEIRLEPAGTSELKSPVLCAFQAERQ